MNLSYKSDMKMKGIIMSLMIAQKWKRQIRRYGTIEIKIRN